MAKFKQRFMFNVDENGHNYLLPIELYKDFEKDLSISSENDEWTDFENKYHQYRINDMFKYSFTDAKEIV